MFTEGDNLEQRVQDAIAAGDVPPRGGDVALGWLHARTHNQPFSVASTLVREINLQDISHRKGWKPSDYIGKPVTIEHLIGEVEELKEALEDLAAGNTRAAEAAEMVELRAHAKEELGDVFACILQTAYRMGISFSELDAEALRKLRLRFLGADKIVL